MKFIRRMLKDFRVQFALFLIIPYLLFWAICGFPSLRWTGRSLSEPTECGTGIGKYEC